jgi:hypothetical protein
MFVAFFSAQIGVKNEKRVKTSGCGEAAVNGVTDVTKKASSRRVPDGKIYYIKIKVYYRKKKVESA